MFIRYRNAKGQFIRADKAQSQKKITSELVQFQETRKGKSGLVRSKKIVSFGAVPFFSDSPKKLSRIFLDLKIREPKEEDKVRTIDGWDTFPDEDELEHEETWDDLHDDFALLARLDELDEIPDDEDEWYHDRFYYAQQREAKRERLKVKPEKKPKWKTKTTPKPKAKPKRKTKRKPKK